MLLDVRLHMPKNLTNSDPSRSLLNSLCKMAKFGTFCPDARDAHFEWGQSGPHVAIFGDVNEDRQFGASRIRAWCFAKLQNASVAHAGNAILDGVDENWLRKLTPSKRLGNPA